VLSGWAFDSRKPNEGVEVEVLLGDKPADRSQGRPPARRPVAVWDRQRPSRLRGRHRRRSAFQHGPGSHSRHRLLPAQRPREGRATQRGGFNNSMLDGVRTLPWGFSQRQPGAADDAFAPRSSPRRAGLVWEAAQAFGTAVEHNSPILTSVSPAYSTAWAAFSAPLGAILSCDDVGLAAWWTQLSLSGSR